MSADTRCSSALGERRGGQVGAAGRSHTVRSECTWTELSPRCVPVLKACGFDSFIQEWCFSVAFWRTESQAERGVGCVWTQKGRGCEVVVGTGTACDPWAPWPPPGPAVGTCAPRNKCLPQAVISKPESLACPARVCVPSIVKRK